MLDYAGVGLAVPTADLQEFMDRWWDSTRQGDAFASAKYDVDGIKHLPVPNPPPPVRPVLGRLTWPVGASRWATFHHLVTQAQLTAIRTAIGSTATAKPLTFSDGAYSIAPDLWMLPARPVARRGELELFLLTLVDERYFWWQEGDQSPDTATYATYADLFDDLFDKVGVSSPTVETVATEYGTPSDRWAVGPKPIPLLLDAAAACVGQRIVRRLDGTVRTVRASTAVAALATEFALRDKDRISGGKIDAVDIGKAAPESVAVVFYGSPPAIDTQTLSSLAISGYGSETGVPGRAGQVWADLAATAPSGDRTDLAKVAATDWYTWALADVEATYRGVVPWVLTGAEDSVEWEVVYDGPEPRILTRVLRPPLGGLDAEGANGGPTGDAGNLYIPFPARITDVRIDISPVLYSWTRIGYTNPPWDGSWTDSPNTGAFNAALVLPGSDPTGTSVLVVPNGTRVLVWKSKTSPDYYEFMVAEEAGFAGGQGYPGYLNHGVQNLPGYKTFLNGLNVRCDSNLSHVIERLLVELDDGKKLLEMGQSSFTVGRRLATIFGGDDNFGNEIHLILNDTGFNNNILGGNSTATIDAQCQQIWLNAANDDSVNPSTLALYTTNGATNAQSFGTYSQCGIVLLTDNYYFRKPGNFGFLQAKMRLWTGVDSTSKSGVVWYGNIGAFETEILRFNEDVLQVPKMVFGNTGYRTNDDIAGPASPVDGINYGVNGNLTSGTHASAFRFRHGILSQVTGALGDLLVFKPPDGSDGFLPNEWSRLPIGTTGQVLTVGDPLAGPLQRVKWATPATPTIPPIGSGGSSPGTTITGILCGDGTAINGRTLTAPAAGITVSNGTGAAGNPTLALADDLAAVEGLGTTGLAARTAASTWTTRTLVAPAAGITIADPGGVGGNPTLALANDLAALEGLGSTGIAVRTAADTWAQRQITSTGGTLTVTNPAGVAGDINIDAAFLQSLTPGGRLTYSSTDPLAYGSSNTSIYYLPYLSNVVVVNDGSKWVMRTFSSINITSFVSDTVYDIFLYDNSGTLAAEKLAWASNTARATALAYQDGVLVKSGDATRRWVGTVYSNFLGVSAEEIGIWNMYNQILRPMTVSNTTSHTYNGTSWRLWGNSIANNRLRFVVGLAGQDLRPGIISDVTNGASSFGAVSVGYDSTTVPNGTTNLLGVASAQHVSGALGTQIAEPGVHTFNGLEICTSANNSTFTSIRLGCSLSC